MLGFVNGLAVVMLKAQLTHFRDPLTGTLLSGARGVTMAALTALTMVFVKLIPKVTPRQPSPSPSPKPYSSFTLLQPSL